MAGLYLHIPFCHKVCTYCNFHFTTNLKGIPGLIDAMILEMQRESDFLEDGTVFETLYLGGGTPSLLPKAELSRLFQAARDLGIASSGEVTLEANPEDITKANLGNWRELGVNRLSIGIQSINDEELQWMNRNHNRREAMQCVETALDAGISSVNIDLIYGSPLMTKQSWEKTLKWAFSSGADHISAYALTVESKTMLHRCIQEGKIPGLSDEAQREQYFTLAQKAEAEGWDFYEISNLCKPGHRAAHNSQYWYNQPYLGIGPSAHSMRANQRWWNVSDNRRYVEGIANNHPDRGGEMLSPTDKYNEYILTRIRTSEGISKAEASALADLPTDFSHVIQQNMEHGYMTETLNRYTLTPAGRLLADAITQSLMK